MFAGTQSLGGPDWSVLSPRTAAQRHWEQHSARAMARWLSDAGSNMPPVTALALSLAKEKKRKEKRKGDEFWRILAPAALGNFVGSDFG